MSTVLLIGATLTNAGVALFFFRAAIIARERRRADRRVWAAERQRYENALAAMRAADDPDLRDELLDLIAVRQRQRPDVSGDAADTR